MHMNSKKFAGGCSARRGRETQRSCMKILLLRIAGRNEAMQPQAASKGCLRQFFLMRCGLLGSQKVNGPISTLRLNTLLYLHLAPINLLVYQGSHREI